jgi:anthranilate phosphoribosyltransferase
MLAFDSSQSPRTAAERAAQAIDSGGANELLRRLAELSHAGL